MKWTTTLLLPVLGFATQALAERPQNLEPVPEPPALPQQVESGHAMNLGEPQITIIRRDNEIIREYRLNGHLYAIKITPNEGAPYYMIDADGDGQLESSFTQNNEHQLLVPMWVLHRW